MLESNLQLKPHQARSFVVSLSGGPDSVALAHAMKALRRRFRFELRFFHVNFGLRNEESHRDEAFVQKLVKSWKLKLDVYRAPARSTSGPSNTQAWARRMRLDFLKLYEPHFEWVEAHHADDQIETFLLRLFQGAGLRGLASIRNPSLREGRLVWRPLLECSKKDLLKYLKLKRLSYVVDRTNLTDHYDRNFIRQHLIPLMESRFPAARASILRTVKLLQRDEEDFEIEYQGLLNQTQAASDRLRWSPLADLSVSRLCRFMHRYLQDPWGLRLTSEDLYALSLRIRDRKAFSVNLPKGLVLQGRLKSRTLPENLLCLRKTLSRGDKT